MRNSVVTALMFLASLVLPYSAAAQEFPKCEFFGGYSYTRLAGSNWFGWHVSGAYNLNNYLGIAVDAGRLGSSSSEGTSDVTYERKNHSYLFMAGPQVTSRGTGKLAPYLHLLFGGATSTYTANVTVVGVSYPSIVNQNEFAVAFGGGIDVQWRGPLSLRPLQVDYMGLRVPGSVFSNPYWNKGWRLSIGMTLRLGHESY